jgi:hypothetical protein
LFLDLSERQAAVDVLDLCQKVDLLAVQFKFDLRIETRIEAAAWSRQELDRSLGLGSQGFNGFVEDAAFGLGKVVHKRPRSPISQVHVT